jgi:hypothetical protein
MSESRQLRPTTGLTFSQSLVSPCHRVREAPTSVDLKLPLGQRHRCLTLVALLSNFNIAALILVQALDVFDHISTTPS